MVKRATNDPERRSGLSEHVGEGALDIDLTPADAARAADRIDKIRAFHRALLRSWSLFLLEQREELGGKTIEVLAHWLPEEE